MIDVRQFDMLLCLANSADRTDLSARCGATPSIPYTVAEKRWMIAAVSRAQNMH